MQHVLLMMLLSAPPASVATQTSEAVAGTAVEQHPTAAVRDKSFFRQLQRGPYVPGELYVRFRAGVSLDSQRALHASIGARGVRWESRLVPGLCRVDVAAGTEAELLQAYLDAEEVMYAEPVYVANPTEIPNDALWWTQWGMTNCRADYAWDMYHGSSTFRIAMIDSGADWAHTDLNGNIWTNAGEIANNGVDDDGNGYIDDLHGYDFALDDSDPDDDVAECGSHGTHTAGIAGARSNNSIGVAGMNWACDLVICKTGSRYWDAPGQFWRCGINHTVEALDYAVIEGCQISSNSWGGTSYTQSMRDEIEAAQDYDHVFVAAAGNDAADNDATPFYPASYGLDNIIAVAAIDSADALANFSNYGATSVDLAAPGVSIRSTIGGGMYGDKSGTSMATPHVAGTAAMIMARYPADTWGIVRSRILSGVRLVNTLDGFVASGGVLDVPWALGNWLEFGFGAYAGSFEYPYRSLPIALSHTPSGGFLYIKAGNSNWTGTINQAVRIHAWGGTVTIGQ